MSDVTIVVPTRNRPGFLAEALSAILAQAEVSLRVVVVDDASEPPAVVPNDPRIELIRFDVGVGVAAARNAGIRKAQSEFVAFCDDDDVWFDHKLVTQMNAIGAQPWSICSALVQADHGAIRAVERAEVLDLVEELRHGNVVPGGCSGVMVRSDVLESIGGFDAELSIFADWRLWQQLAAIDSPAVSPEPLLFLREHEGQMVSAAAAANAELKKMVEAGWVASRATAAQTWIYHRAKRGGIRARSTALLASWNNLDPRARLKLLGATLQPDSIRTRREVANGKHALSKVDPADRRDSFTVKSEKVRS